MSLANDYEHGTHIFAYHFHEKKYRDFNRAMRDRHRLIWMKKYTLNEFGSDKYSAMIQEQVDFESQWCEKLRPRSVSDSSLLPETSFSPKTCKDMWSRIRSIHLDKKDDLNVVYKLILHFRETHYNKGCWEDANGIQFRAAPERHGLFPKYGNIKFTYRLPDGFHYNVQSARTNRKFYINDSQGKSHGFHKNTNIDCFGSIRGGH